MVQYISGKVVNVGRKWIKIVQNGRNEKYPENLLISELTDSFRVGDTFKNLLVETEREEGYRGIYKYTHIATTEEKLKQKEIDRWWGYVKNTYEKENRIYKKGVNKLHELKCHEHDEEINEMEKNVEIKNAIYWIRHNYQEKGYIYSKGIDVLNKYNVHDYDEEIAKMRNELEESYIENEKKYVEWTERADYSSALKNGSIVIRDERAYKISSCKYYRAGELGEPWSTYVFKGIDVSDTNEGKILLTEYLEKASEARREFENTKIIGSIIESIENIIRENDILHHEKVEEFPVGEEINNTFNHYGGGNMILIDKNYAWYIVNHSADGDDWARNNIASRAYGYKCNIELVSDLIKEYKEKIKEKNDSFSGNNIIASERKSIRAELKKAEEQLAKDHSLKTENIYAKKKYQY